MAKDNKPIKLILLGWTWIIFSVISCINTVVNYQKLLGKKKILDKLFNDPPNELENLMVVFKPICENLNTIFLAKILLAIVAFIAAISFLRSMNWSKKILEIISWIYVLLLLYYIYLIINWNTISIEAGYGARVTNISLIIMCSFIVPFLLSGYILRTNKSIIN